MTTKFKVGDRVSHSYFGDGEVKADIGACCFLVRFDSRTQHYHDDNDGHEVTESEIRKIRPDTRKRLREYTDLCDGDVAVIAGVPFTVDGDALTSGETCIWATQMPWAAMLVDEVRRKPKRRRVLEEIDARDVRAGDVIIYEDGRMVVDNEDGRSMHKVAAVFRLIEETEVPR